VHAAECIYCGGELDDARARATSVCSLCWEDRRDADDYDDDELGIDPEEDYDA